VWQRYHGNGLFPFQRLLWQGSVNFSNGCQQIVYRSNGLYTYRLARKSERRAIPFIKLLHEKNLLSGEYLLNKCLLQKIGTNKHKFTYQKQKIRKRTLRQKDCAHPCTSCSETCQRRNTIQTPWAAYTIVQEQHSSKSTQPSTGSCT